ncbi:Aminotransferase-like mobile domain-containing protein [Artemisia annua]|uniref:Aminotransferase-like mobile domain-containing protein n=1 Tax=Artemisia annua TaxID=35608 RepID=A0A2U1QF76_ARTAN|nr:Aminotransferase-like mobile domain-containing protein [Artemisia annua]
MSILKFLVSLLGLGCSQPKTLPQSPIPNLQAVRPQLALLGAEDDEDLDEIGFINVCRICCNDKRKLSYECKRGHAICSFCYKMLKGKCAICQFPGRNFDGVILRPIENEVIVRPIANNLIKMKNVKKIRVECKNKKFGCYETMRPTKKATHEETCPQTECFCPFPSCDFSNSFMELHDHVRHHHALSVTSFTFNRNFALELGTNQKHVILQEENVGVIFILNHCVQNLRRVFNVDCIGPPPFNNRFVYKLYVDETEAGTFSMRTIMKSRPEVLSKWEEHAPKKNYLTIAASDTEEVLIHVCIRNVGPNYLF